MNAKFEAGQKYKNPAFPTLTVLKRTAKTLVYSYDGVTKDPIKHVIKIADDGSEYIAVQARWILKASDIVQEAN